MFYFQLAPLGPRQWVILGPLKSVLALFLRFRASFFVGQKHAWLRNLNVCQICRYEKSFCTPFRIMIHRNHLLDHLYVIFQLFGHHPPPLLQIWKAYSLTIPTTWNKEMLAHLKSIYFIDENLSFLLLILDVLWLWLCLMMTMMCFRSRLKA